MSPDDTSGSSMLKTVAELLAVSRACHDAYRRGDRSALQEAWATRAQAHHLDPTHTDPAWRPDQRQHEALMTFYAAQAAQARRTP